MDQTRFGANFGIAMKFQPVTQRNFLFLQGPPGPFFWQLSQQLQMIGCGIFRINLNGGDAADWPGTATDYRGSRKRWTLFIDRFLSDHSITDIVLFGDCRPLHMAAHRMAQLRKIDVHVFEEGYIRPDWLTLEPSGVNGNSSLPRDPAFYLAEARGLPAVPDRPAITANFGRRARDAYRYYSRVVLGRPFYPYYSSHRQGSLLLEGIGWLYKFAREKRDAARTEAAIAHLSGAPYFLFPLQLSNDFQIREHSPFHDMKEALDYVLYSFARRAPEAARLVIKEHPLDSSLQSWRRHIIKRARKMGIAERVIHIAGGNLAELAASAEGVVTVNSTSATLSLVAGVPTIALGKAIYDIPDITHQGRLDEFWVRPQAPDRKTYEAFCRVLYDRCLIYGGLASESATNTLVESALERLVGRRVNLGEQAQMKVFG
ncbi:MULTISPECIES: capsule biosynthesis protein [unclassified Sphingobium]|uniref:capsule biosynthesis protein n=1 Tax=unclassified Sphingobium TaxID=2611147 RepID=UPI002224066B|nr:MULTISPECIES: capsular biosynthesis protein [unclassified Sphingobium]MCW2411762.1 capsular polysaccharide export protein [Sphingobium sp. B8D3D]MCW2415941.1 capsular polysaccharide export protein [Sphingobium sp. B8D3A]